MTTLCNSAFPIITKNKMAKNGWTRVKVEMYLPGLRITTKKSREFSEFEE